MTDLALFGSRAELEAGFAAGLATMLARHRGLGVYILVLANALQDPALWARLRDPLRERHHFLERDIVAALRQGRRVPEPDDDLLVFLKLLAIGFDYLAPVEHKHLVDPAGGIAWEVQFNPVRALRPVRMSDARVEGIMRPFDHRGFHFNKPFLGKEVLWEGELAGKPARLLYNKFPFAPLHGLLVPEPALERPQFLTPELHGWAWVVTRRLGAALPGFGLGFNSYGAHASVNHLHFQTYVRERLLPAQAYPGASYPLPRLVFSEPEAAWFALDELHEKGQIYNLVYSSDGVLVIPRVRQGETPPETWASGFAWSEVAGVFPITGWEDFDRLGHADLGAALARLAPG